MNTRAHVYCTVWFLKAKNNLKFLIIKQSAFKPNGAGNRFDLEPYAAASFLLLLRDE